jgi:hypothetical protein
MIMKKCSIPNCSNPVFSNNLCKYHTPKKAISKFNIQPVSEANLFYDIYMNKNTKGKWFSELSNLKLYQPSSIYFYNQFAHILPKSKYPNLKLDVDNIITILPEEHYLLDFGTVKQRNEYAIINNCDWSLIEKRKLKLLNSLL